MATKSNKILKIIGYSFLVLIIISIIVGLIGMRKFNNSLFTVKPNYLEYTSESKPIHFNWANDSIGNHFEMRTAMNLPMTIDGLPQKFYLQFDTGSPYTFIYENVLKSFENVGINFKEVVKDDERYIQNLKCTIGGNHINVSMIRILENYGNTFNKNDTLIEINIGTLGSDFMDKRITVIDYKNQSLQFHNERPQWMDSLPRFQPFDFKGRRFMLPATINDKKLELFYDSGSSAFGLITTKDRYDDYTDKNVAEIKFDANSWGDGIPIHHKRTDKMMEIGNTTLSLRRISYVDIYGDYQKFMTPFTRIGGWLGNKPFTESTLIFDTKKEEFIVIESSINK